MEFFLNKLSSSVSLLSLVSNSGSGVNIDLLPNECLERIMKELPVQQTMHLRRVCRRWKAVIEKTYESKKMLTLIDSGRGSLDMRVLFFGELKNMSGCSKEEQVNSKLSLKRDFNRGAGGNIVSTDFCLAMIKMFPNLTHLGIYLSIFDDPSSNRLADMLTAWAESLTTLIWSVRGDVARDLADHRVNILKKLERFRLENVDQHGEMVKEFPLRETLNRLGCFSLAWNLPPKNLASMVRNLGPNCNRFEFTGFVSEQSMHQILSANPQLPRRLTHLSLKLDSSIADQLLEALVANFVNLKVLHVEFTISFDDKTIEAYKVKLDPFGRLPSLTELELGLVQLDLDALEASPAPLLASLRTLHLWDVRISTAGTRKVRPDDSQAANRLGTSLAKLFPNLQSLTFEWPDWGETGGVLDLDEDFKQHFDQLETLKAE